MPTEAEFEAFYKEHEGKNYGLDRRREIIKERWPLKEDFDAYRAWKRDRADRMWKKWMAPASASEFIDLVSTMDLTNKRDVADLRGTSWKEGVPCIPIGIDDDNTCYRLVPCTDLLRPDRRISESSVQGEILGDEILGVNTNVHPRYPEKPDWRCKLGLPEMSSDPNESDWKEGGFVFHQLGNLEFRCAKPEGSQDPDLSKGPWFSSWFCVVIRFRSDGVSEGIYIIYNFYPVYDDGEQAETKIIQEDVWGLLPGPEEDERQYFMAKIADNINELGVDRKLTLSEEYEYPLEIVPAMRTSAGTIVRTTVARN